MSEATDARCAAMTQAGTRCKNKAQPNSAYCHIHKKMETAAAKPATAENGRRQALAAELDELVAELRETMPPGSSPYSPLRLLTLVRDNLSNMTPDVQLGILESFEGMTREDMMDMETWKGLAYMLGYSARFQADQVRERMNQQMPDPLKPDTLLEFVKQNVDRFTPDLAKGLMQNFQGASKEDFLDPETWKGMWYMVNYSLQFQMEQMKQRMSGEAVEDDV